MRSRAAVGLLLLAVMAHAFVAGATHFHGRDTPGEQTPHHALQGGDDGGGSVPLTGDEAQCLLCRLQRSLVSDQQGAAFALAPPSADALGYAPQRDAYARQTRSLFPSGRAPPAA